MRILNVALCAITALLCTACVSALTPLGDSKYDCNRKENPDSPYCHSFKAVEASTAGALPPSRYDQVMKITDHDRMQGIAPVAAASEAAPNAPSVAPGPVASGASAPVMVGPRTASLEGAPVRVGPVVQRVWVKSHRTDGDLLVGDTKVYRELVPSRWAGFTAVDPAARGAVGASGAFPHRAPSSPVTTLGSKPLDAPRGVASQRPDFVQPAAAAAAPVDDGPMPE